MGCEERGGRGERVGGQAPEAASPPPPNVRPALQPSSLTAAPLSTQRIVHLTELANVLVIPSVKGSNPLFTPDLFFCLKRPIHYTIAGS